MPLGPHASLLTQLFHEHKEFMKLQYTAWVAAGSPSGGFPTLEETTEALAAESRNSAAAATAATAAPRNSAAATAATAAPRNSAAATAATAAPRNSATRSNSAAVTTVAPSSTKITWAAVAARK